VHLQYRSPGSLRWALQCSSDNTEEIAMIRTTAFYPAGPNATFDFDYYKNRHFPMVLDLMKPFGAIRFEVEKPLATVSGEPAPYLAVGTIWFDDMPGIQAGLAQHGATIMGDIPNYTNVTPVIQFGEIV
jgi:uncharacterized protein (TIGR02118 family)